MARGDTGSRVCSRCADPAERGEHGDLTSRGDPAGERPDRIECDPDADKPVGCTGLLLLRLGGGHESGLHQLLTLEKVDIGDEPGQLVDRDGGVGQFLGHRHLDHSHGLAELFRRGSLRNRLGDLQHRNRLHGERRRFLLRGVDVVEDDERPQCGHHEGGDDTCELAAIHEKTPGGW